MKIVHEYVKKAKIKKMAALNSRWLPKSRYNVFEYKEMK